MNDKVKVYFSQGTLLVEGGENQLEIIRPYIKFDPRVKMYRAKAFNYAPIILSLHRMKVEFEDQAKAFIPLELTLSDTLTPRPHQKEALDCWLEKEGRGIVVLPTGSGKSFLAVMAINHIQRPALVIVPTIDLMQQWASQLERFFNVQIGMLGGGSKDVQNLTVSTYDSAVLQMEYIGNRFGVVIFDECHHLPGPVNKLSAEMCIAPYRMGLTATPDREDDGELIMADLIGDIAYEAHIDEMEGDVLSPYKTERVWLSLDPDEEEAYILNRKVYTNFLRANGITFSNKNDWNKFIILCSRLPHGKDVMQAYLTQKRIARNGRSKARKVWELINKHRGERIIIFTAENDTAYDLGKNFFLPVITHRTKVAERKEFLDKFREGEYPVLVTSKVLNEGVDVPEASVGIVVSGSGSIREHVQRLGRILRPKKDGRQAILYELVSEGTSETRVSERRRGHRAYKRSRYIQKNR